MAMDCKCGSISPCCDSDSEPEDDFSSDEIEIELVPKAGRRLIFFLVKGTVITHLWWQLLFVSVWTMLIVCLHLYEPSGFFKSDTSHTMIPILGRVTGLLLTFRLNTAYDRYYEGRRLWTSMLSHTRTLARQFSVIIPEKCTEDLLEKRGALNLLIAYSYSVKNYLRRSFDYEEIARLVGHIPEFNKELLPPKKIKKKFVSKCHDSDTPTKIPMDIAYHLTAYIQNCRVKNYLDPSTAISLQNNVSSLVECFGNMERIKNTPIPFNYAIHLHHVVWIYIVTLPSQLVQQLNWWTIPSVVLAAFTFLGLLEIAWEVENPFARSGNELPLTRFCKLTEQDILGSVSKRLPKPDELYKTIAFKPCRTSQKNAKELLEMKLEDAREHITEGPSRRHIALQTVGFL